MARSNWRMTGVVFSLMLATAASGWSQGALTRTASPLPPPPPAAAQAPLVQSPPAAPPPAPLSLLQQPASEAQIVFSNERLAIHAENSSLTAILHQIATTTGMRITGLGNDERVFGTFGPGAPRDVIADLLNGTAYNQLLLGDLSNGVPRELILTPATRAGEQSAPAAAPANSDDAVPDQEVSDVAPPPPPDVTPAQQQATPPGQGARTPQQLFEQLQQMRQAQQQQLSQPADLPAPPPQ